MKKRIISSVLVFAMMLSLLPMPAMAALGSRSTEASDPYVEVEKDNNSKEVTVKPHNAPDGSAVYFAWYQANGRMLDIEIWTVDAKSHKFPANEDAKYAKVFLLDKTTGGPLTPAEKVLLNTETYKVTFYDGKREIETMEAVEGEPLGKVPSVEKSSRADGILVGYFTDEDCTQPFYAENPVTEDLKVYAKYEEMEPIEELSFTSFAEMDLSPDVSFEIQGSGDPEQAVTLEVMDGSAPVELAFDAVSGGYKVYAPEGFNEGCSYQLTLAEGWTFKDKPETIRTASFAIDKAEVENLQMNDEILYIQDTASMDYTVGGKKYEVLTADLVTNDGGSFNYSGSRMPAVGDILCVYVGTRPDQRSMDGEDVTDPAVYAKVTAVSGSTVSFTALGQEDQQKLYNVPDNFPIQVADPDVGLLGKGTVNISGLDVAMYQTMMGSDYDLAKAKEAIEVGDFVTLYTSTADIESPEDLVYGEITGYDPATGEITFKETTREAILTSMDLYSGITVEGDDLVTEEEKEALEGQILRQIQETTFAEDAAYMLADMVTATDGFSEGSTLQSISITDDQGNPLTPGDLARMNLGGTMELSDDVKLTVELITKGEQLHFSSGVQLAVGIDAEFEVEVEDDGKIAIELSATFVQEVSIAPKVKGEIVYKEILWIPVPIGVKVGATIDIKSFTALSFAAQVYTVGAEDKSTWDKLKNITEKPAEALGLDNLPKDLVKGLSTVGDVMDKITELEDLAAKAEDLNQQYQGYLDDAAALWNVVEKNGLTTQEDWAAMAEELESTSITSDLLDLMDLTNETGLSTEYYDSFQALMDRYCEMLEQESDWVKLVEQEMFSAEYFAYGLCIGVEANFVVRTDLSLAIGSNLQYEVGKRYEFWFKIGLFKPTAGSSTMDLIDEKFAFQFYVMGRLGVKAGVEAKLYVGLGTGDFASVGISAELGPYLKLYGFFVYEYEKYRAANTDNWVSDERMAGALFLEFGLYFMLGFEANALGDLFEYEYQFLDEEFPLLTAGDQRYYYDLSYEAAPDEAFIIQNQFWKTLPKETRSLAFVDLDTGLMGYEILDPENYIYTLSNPNFTYNTKNGTVNVTVPDGTRYMECDLTITYKHSKVAFSTYDMSVTIPMVWTNLSTSELSEYYTASVRVGNNEDGFTTIWKEKVRKNTAFDLPTAEEVQELMGWNGYAHIMGTGYNGQQLEGLTLIEDEVYDFNIDFRNYALKVTDVQTASGTKETRIYTADFGKSFDFSDLKGTGTASNGTYTIFAALTNSAGLDLDKAIDSKFAQALSSGLTAQALYVDNSVKAIFSFTGLDHQDMTMTLQKGTEPDLSVIEAIVSDYGLALKDIYPAVGPMTATTNFQVVCGELTGPKATISFQENGGSEVADIEKVIGSLIGNLPTPTREGYTFGGWYADAGLTTPFEGTKVPEGGLTLYAKWTAQEVNVTFHVNGGEAWTDGQGTKTVAYDGTYGDLPTPTKTGFGFVGWFTASEGGEQVTAETKVSTTANHTLYAQWRELIEISPKVFSEFYFTNMNNQPIYEKGKVQGVQQYTFTPEEGATYTEDEFTFWYMHEEETEFTTEPVDAGRYILKITRPADDTYAKFEHTYTTSNNTYFVIQKTTHDKIQDLPLEVVASGLTWMELRLVDDDTMADSGICDLHPKAQILFRGYTGDEDFQTDKFHKDDTILLENLYPGDDLSVYLRVYDRNYGSSESTFYYESKTGAAHPYGMDGVKLKELIPAPTGSWLDEGNYLTTWYSEDKDIYSLVYDVELAGLAYLVNVEGVDFTGKTIRLARDMDMSEFQWVPIGTTDNPFRGVFEGAGKTISGIYVNDPYEPCQGLFGYVEAVLEVTLTGITSGYKPIFSVAGEPTIIQNVVLDDSFLYAGAEIGGIVGAAGISLTGSSASYFASSGQPPIGTVQINNCVSYARVVADSSVDNAFAGGIAGKLNSTGILVSNCVNYGPVSSDKIHVGGIVGYNVGGKVVNCANFGAVNGTNNVGGIVGTSEGAKSFVSNTYNCGTVKGTGTDYIGAIVGRNTSDEGKVINGYYLEKSAKAGSKVRTGLGKSGGAVDDGYTPEGKTRYTVAVFTSPTSLLANTCEYHSNNLITALNAWAATEDAADYGAVTWVSPDTDTYPLPEGLPVSALR